MGNYQIKVNIKIEESSDPITNELNKTDDGSFKFNISEEDAISIDKCENAVLKINYAALRESIASHLEEISKKNPLNQRKKED